MTNTEATQELSKTKVAKMMKAAGIEGELRGKGTNWEVEVANEETMNDFFAKVVKAGGYRTGYGSWVLQGEYKDKGDYNSPCSAWHY